jgi:hypothetical protein
LPYLFFPIALFVPTLSKYKEIAITLCPTIDLPNIKYLSLVFSGIHESITCFFHHLVKTLRTPVKPEKDEPNLCVKRKPN